MEAPGGAGDAKHFITSSVAGKDRTGRKRRQIMIRVISRVLLSIALLVFLSGGSMAAQPAKPEHPSKTEHPKAATPKAETPKAEHPKAAQPKAEHPKAAQPKAEHPKAAPKKPDHPK